MKEEGAGDWRRGDTRIRHGARKDAGRSQHSRATVPIVNRVPLVNEVPIVINEVPIVINVVPIIINVVQIGINVVPIVNVWDCAWASQMQVWVS